MRCACVIKMQIYIVYENRKFCGYNRRRSKLLFRFSCFCRKSMLRTFMNVFFFISLNLSSPFSLRIAEQNVHLHSIWMRFFSCLIFSHFEWKIVFNKHGYCSCVVAARKTIMPSFGWPLNVAMASNFNVNYIFLCYSFGFWFLKTFTLHKMKFALTNWSYNLNETKQQWTPHSITYFLNSLVWLEMLLFLGKKLTK